MSYEVTTPNILEKQTKAYYTNIMGIRLTKHETIPYSLIRKKNTWRYWKLWGIIPIYKYKIKENIYYIPSYTSSDGILESHLCKLRNVKILDHDIYIRPSLEIKYKDRFKKDIIYYDSDAIAEQEFQKIAEICKECGNALF